MKIGNRIFDTKHDCYIMGILNVTPDSFSDGGKWNDMERARQHAAARVISRSLCRRRLTGLCLSLRC